MRPFSLMYSAVSYKYIGSVLLATRILLNFHCVIILLLYLQLTPYPTPLGVEAYALKG